MQHPPWRAFLPAIAGVGLQQPGRYAALFFRRVHYFRVELVAISVDGVIRI
jgi:hypothetical protein